MRKVKVINRITLEFNRDELEEIRNLLMTITMHSEQFSKETVAQASDWVDVIYENMM
jgi:hypothetical protein|tara:strand:+ start:344 stop:514 length:171 start_codon:yes stop_codon:yes gene_type:complete